MRAVQVVFDPVTLRDADRQAKREKLNRSAFLRKTVAAYLQRCRELEQEARHRRGYELQPVQPGEFDPWDKVQAWPEK